MFLGQRGTYRSFDKFDKLIEPALHLCAARRNCQQRGWRRCTGDPGCTCVELAPWTVSGHHQARWKMGTNFVMYQLAFNYWIIVFYGQYILMYQGYIRILRSINNTHCSAYTTAFRDVHSVSARSESTSQRRSTLWQCLQALRTSASPKSNQSKLNKG